MAATSLHGSINVAVVGAGLVGGAVISQITSSPVLSQALRIVSVQNSRKILYPQGPIGADWPAQLAASAEPAPGPSRLVEILTSLAAGKHTVVVDNTSNDTIASAYPLFLRAGFSVVTPNKKAYSSSKALFDDIVKAVEEKAGPQGPLIQLESTVGAGLPIISTLKDLVATGDEIHKIEGVFSGTLSYIFNVWCPASLDSTANFSEVVAVAKKNGYTEPYPGDDLSGSDVARKLTILSRLVPSVAKAAPLPEGYASVPTKSLTPDKLTALEKEGKVADGDDYIAKLAEFDEELASLREEAKKEGKVWRYVGVIDAQSGQVKASLEKYDATHPFAASLGGSDNIVSFSTKRYPARPLLVQGAGAGADVTAMGVVADIIKIAERRAA